MSAGIQMAAINISQQVSKCLASCMGRLYEKPKYRLNYINQIVKEIIVYG